jgi:ribosome-associated protein
MTQEAAAKKDTQKLQRAIIDGLEDVKGQDIQVFNTEHLSPLFERVIVASGTSNRQTRALASSVIDAVREAGFPKPRIEGEDNGEWIIVDCGAAVAHIMQPAIRQYYHLEEIWGEKPVRLRVGAPKPQAPVQTAAPTPAKKVGTSLRRSSAAKSAARDADREEAAAKKAPAKRGAGNGAAKATPSRAPARSTANSPAGKAATKRPSAPAKSRVAKSAPAKSTTAKSAGTAKGTTAKGTTAKSAAAKSTAAKSAPAKSTGARSTGAKGTAARGTPAKKAPARSAGKSTASRH